MKNLRTLHQKSLFLVIACMPLLSIASTVTTNYEPQFVPAIGNDGRNTSGIYNITQGLTFLDPVQSGEQLNPTANWTNVFNESQFGGSGGWTFRNSDTELSDNSLAVKTYAAEGTPDFPGSEFHINYNPGLGDPTTATHEIHWIQVVKNNHLLDANNQGEHGIEENKIDVKLNGNFADRNNPFYDNGFAAGNSNEENPGDSDFYDVPHRTDSENAHDWSAEVFLVTTPLDSDINDPQEITVWSGATWGWSNLVPASSLTPVPVPATMWLFSSGLLGLIGIAKQKRS